MVKQKRIIVSVITDLVSDQRVHKVCTYVHQKGFEVILVGRKFSTSQPVEIRAYTTDRILCYFNKGILQYAEFNLRLFFWLFSKKADIYLSNDLDTLLPNYLHSTIRKSLLVYDSHEFFTGTPELMHKPIKRKLWQWLEKKLMPRADFLYTVNQSIADLYKDRYGVDMKVLRNVPFSSQNFSYADVPLFEKSKFVLLFQGAGINKDRGAEELIDAISLIPNNFLLVLVGGGDVWDDLKKRTEMLQLVDKVLFIEKMPFHKLKQYTSQAHLGISLDKPNCINHQLSLPNKVFDYIHAGVPILASDIVEVKKVIDNYEVGYCIKEVTPQAIAEAILWIYKHPEVYQVWKKNTKDAAKELSWENEQSTLDSFFNSF